MKRCERIKLRYEEEKRREEKIGRETYSLAPPAENPVSSPSLTRRVIIGGKKG